MTGSERDSRDLTDEQIAELRGFISRWIQDGCDPARAPLTVIVDLNSRAVPSLLARARKAEARVSELLADCDACVGCEGDTLSPDGLCARCKLGELEEEREALVVRLASAEAKLAKIRDWATGDYGGTKRPIDVWPGLAAALATAATLRTDDRDGAS